MTTGSKRKPRALKVGVTLFIREGYQSIWENGIYQNCYFLLMLLARAPNISKTFIVNGGPGDPKDAGDFLAMAPAPVIDMDTAHSELDVIIELSAQLNPDWTRSFKARGGRVIGMRVANDYIIDIERMIYNLSPGLLMSGTPYDSIWTLPAFVDTCGAYYAATSGVPVKAMPHLWNHALIERSIKEVPDRQFGYVPGRKRWRLAVLEPNICTVKTCHLPLLLADEAHRRNRNAIEVLRIYSTTNVRAKPEFVGFARSLDLVLQGLASFEDRFPIYDVMAGADAIVSHHWHNAQNYLYYEALWGGFPLIHNSGFLGGCGYRYRDFDSEDGALALLEALRSHDAGLDDYKRDAATFLQRLSPTSEENIATYAAAIAEVAG